MSQTLLELAFGAASLNDPDMTTKFGATKYDRFAQDLFSMHGRNHSEKAQGRNVPVAARTLSRKPAPFSSPKSPAVALEGQDVDLSTVTMADIKISSEPIPIEEITSEIAARNIVADTYEELAKRLGISKELFAWMALKGAVTINGTTVPGSTVGFAYTQPVTALTVAAAWNLAGTKLASSELDLFHQAHHDASGLEIARLVVDRKIKGYVTQNSEVQVMLTGGERKSDALAKTTQILGPSFRGFEFNGYDWDVHGAKYDKDGTLTKYLGDDQALALPDAESLRSVLAYAEGYGAIPREAIGPNADSLGSKAPQRGVYVYAYTTPNPAAVTVVMGWCGTFFLTHPEAIGYCADVNTP